MHVRGSSLSHPRVVEALRPFVVTFWAQRDQEPIPAEIRPFYASTGRGGSNVRCFVLDFGGGLRYSFNGFPGQAANPTAYTAEAYADYFAGEIRRGSAGLPLPQVAQTMRLPEPKDGVRLFIRLPEAQGSYGYPVVESVENQEEWKTLERSTAVRSIDAGKLSRWLRLCYPPGVNEQLKPFEAVKGTLTLKPVGKDQALLSGPIKMRKTAAGYDLFEGSIEAVLTYTPKLSMRGVVEGVYWRHEPRRGRWMDWRLTAAIESRPQ